MLKVAFIGLGIMGSRMAANLLKNKVELRVYNRSEGPAQELEKKGAIRSTSISDAVIDADLVFTMLANPKAVEAVMLGEGGGLSHMKSGALWIDSSTVHPSFTLSSYQEAKRTGVHYLDAPVAGTKPHAANAELVFFVGGPKDNLSKAQPYLEMMGKKVMHIGETSMGASFKMLVNGLLAQSMIIFSEAVLLGQKMGLDKDFLLNTLPNLVVSAPFTKAKAEMIRSGDYEVQFPLELMHKDLHLASLAAYEVEQPLFLVNLAKEVFAKAKENGLGRKDFAAIHEYLQA